MMHNKIHEWSMYLTKDHIGFVNLFIDICFKTDFVINNFKFFFSLSV